ncbi:hypothetical protein DY000_02004407 [Brassica cretica]|uniref:UspA domain-containing protein n=1 Tax=Brassica cretica TaxID=69181 RepID=A0ABQ7CKS1_BRACR|nr:hypothetical protein DY000_02004407 [Brassica cretica]
MEESSGRKIGVAVDFSECSKKALNWAIDSVVRDGDHLILITVAHDIWIFSGFQVIVFVDESCYRNRESESSRLDRETESAWDGESELERDVIVGLSKLRA